MKLKQSAARWAALGALGLLAVSAQAIDLVGAYDQALRHDPAKLAADEAVVAGREHAVQGDSLLRPRVSLQAGLNHVDDHTTVDGPPAVTTQGAGYVRQASVQLSQPLYDPAAWAAKRQLHLETDLAETQFSQARQELTQRVAEAYFGVLLAEEALRVTEAERATVGKQRERAQARFDVGRGRITDLQEVQARLDQLLTKEISARSTLELRRAQFLETTGAPAEGLARLTAEFKPSLPEPDSLQAWQARGEDHSILVQVRRSLMAVARAEIDKYRLSARPTVSLVASYTAGGQNGGLSAFVAPSSERTGVLGVQLNVPLYSGGAIESRLRESTARLSQADEELAAARRDVRLQVQDAYLAVRTGVASVSSFEQSLLSARTALEATTLGRDVGTRTELDVLDAQQRAFDAELDLVHARFDYLLGRIRLAAAVGELGEQDLRAVNGWFVAP